MPRNNLRSLWPYLTLPAVMLVLLVVAVMGAQAGGGCSGHGDQRVTTLGGRCALLVPSR